MQLFIRILARIAQGMLVGHLAYSAPVAIIIVNLVPIAGILFFDWSYINIFATYLIEFLVFAFYNSLHIITLGKDSFAFEDWWFLKKIAWGIGIFLFVFIFIGSILTGYIFLSKLGESDKMYYIEITAAMFIGYGISFIKNYSRAKEYYFDFFLQIIGPKFIYFMAALILGFYLNTKFDTESGIWLILPVVLIKGLVDYGYERSQAFRFYMEAFRIRKG